MSKDCLERWLMSFAVKSANAPKFYLGTHKPEWLWGWLWRETNIPLFVSIRRLKTRSTLYRANASWALDSGGFSELSLFGTWTITPKEYVSEVRRYSGEIGSMDWAAIQDWMTEPMILQKTGLTMAEHQERTVNSFIELTSLAPEIPWMPVIQGFSLDEYLECADLYARKGIKLEECSVVGVGSICRRQHTNEASTIVHRLADVVGLRKLHVFGYKIGGLSKVSDVIKSADSMAWSLAARKEAPLQAHKRLHSNCANCHEYAVNWYNKVIGRLGQCGVNHE